MENIFALATGTPIDEAPAFRAPPRNEEAEQALLGAILVNNQAFQRVSEIIAAELTGHDVDDGGQVEALLDRCGGPIAFFTADGAYDRDDVYIAVAARSPDAAAVIPPRSSAVLSATENAKPTQRDAHIAAIAEYGRMGWQRRSGYNWRALVEADVSRWKRIIGDGLRSRTDDRRTTEVAIAARALNRMLKLGRPEYLRTA